MKPFQLLIKPVSAGCNIACEYCFYRRVEGIYPKTPTESMPLDILEKLLKEHLELRLRHSVYGWQGGEPTLAGVDFFKKVVELQMKHGAKGQVVANSLQTNGILLDDEWCEFLAKYRFLVGLSLDGPPFVHNKYRKDRAGEGTHERVIKAARLMSRHGVQYNALSVITPYMADKAKEVYRWFANNGFNYMQFIPCCDLDPETGKPTEWFVTPEMYSKFLIDLFDEWYPKDVGRISVRFFDALTEYAADHRMSTWCTFGKSCDEYLLVEYNGDIYPCDFFVYPEWKLGSLTTGSLQEAADSPRRKEFAKAKYRPDLCSSCRFFTQCHGGCQKDRMVIDDERSVYCPAYQKFFNHAMDKFDQLAEQVKEMRRERVKLWSATVGRNDPCPCGSGRKFKQCCART